MLILRQPAGEVDAVVDLGVIGVDDQFQTEEEVRTVEHRLNDGSYIVDITGREPVRWTLTGNCETRAPARPTADGRTAVRPQDELSRLSRLIGRWVTLEYYNSTNLGLVSPYSGTVGTAFIKRVRTTGRIILYDELLYTTWTLELVFADSRAAVPPDTTLARQLGQNAHGKLPGLTAAAVAPPPAPEEPEPESPTALTFAAPPSQSHQTGQPGSATWAVATGGTGPYTYTQVSSNIANFAYDVGTRTLSWTAAAVIGTYQFTVKATDSATPTPATVDATFYLTITEATPAPMPVRFDPDDPGITVRWESKNGNQQYTSLPSAERGTLPYTYSLRNAPAGVSIDATSRALTDSHILLAGDYMIDMVVTDASGDTASYRFRLIVTDR